MIRKDFIEVEGYFPGYTGLESSLVPTKEEYDDFRQRLCKALDRLESRIAAIEEPIDKSKESKEVCPDAWKELEIYVKVGFYDPTVFVPVLVLERGTKFTGKPINLEDALPSAVATKVRDIRDQARALGIPKVTVVLDKSSGAFVDYLIEKGVADEYCYDKHFYDFFAELSQSEAIHSFLDRIH